MSPAHDRYADGRTRQKRRPRRNGPVPDGIPDDHWLYAYMRVVVLLNAIVFRVCVGGFFFHFLFFPPYDSVLSCPVHVRARISVRACAGLCVHRQTFQQDVLLWWGHVVGDGVWRAVHAAEIFECTSGTVVVVVLWLYGNIVL